MDKEYVMQVANMVRAQLSATTSIDVIGSWGVSNFIAKYTRICRHWRFMSMVVCFKDT